MKEVLLAKSNFKKKKNITIAIGLIMLLTAFLISLSLLLMLDAYPNSNKYAKKLNAGDGVSIIYNDFTDIDDNAIEIALAGAKEYQKTDYLFFPVQPIKTKTGEIATNLLINDSKVFNKKIERTQIVSEDKNITSDYIYLSYQLNTSFGGLKIGDKYKVTLNGKEYEYTIKGFTATATFGCNNSGFFEYVLDDVSYEKLLSECDNHKAYVISYKVDKNIKAEKLRLQVMNEIQKINSNALFDGTTLGSAIVNRGFMSLILSISFITVSVILLVVVVLMLVNSISNFIKENMKEIGTLKAIGYTSKNIRLSLMLQFLVLSIIGSIVGVLFGYIFMPFMGGIVKSQQGLPYNVSFNLLAIFVPIIFIILFTLLIVYLSSIKIKKIEPIVALREGLETHNFKKNRIPLEKSKFNLNISLALKTLFNNLGQNIITFFIFGFIVFTCVVALLMFENFNRKPRIDMLTFETCSGVITVDKEKANEVYDYLKNNENVTNVKNLININTIYGDNDAALWTYIIDDIDKLNNKNICYKGRLPKYDNEIAVSGKFLKDYGYKIGDEIEITYSGKNKVYLISGYTQTCNNGGREALLTASAARDFIDLSTIDAYYWFDSSIKGKEILDEVKDKFGDAILSTMDFDEIMEVGLSNFKSIASIMLIAILIVSSLVILLVLYLLVKSLMQKKRKEYGILKAMGYKSKDLILQTAISFMPSIIISTILFSFISYALANPYMNLMMVNFGMMKCNFSIPVIGIVLVDLFLVLLSFGFAIFEARRIKRIEPYNLLIAE